MTALRKYSPARLVRDTSLHVSKELLRLLGTEKSLEILSHLDNSDFLKVVSASVSADDYKSAEQFAKDYLACEFLSKFPSFKIDSVDRKKEAFSKFLHSEVTCASVNCEVVPLYRKGKLNPFVQSVIFTACKKIRDVLGPFSWDQAEVGFDFGPGATFSRKQVEGDRYHKFGLKPSVTRSCSVLAHSAIRRVPLWHYSRCMRDPTIWESGEDEDFEIYLEKFFDIVPGNRIVTVPKNAKIDRIIAIEPCMNVYIQKGIGSLLRNRLKRAGVDLNDQTRNQSLAKIGSETNGLSTIDLSSASDSIALSLVEVLLPPDWFSAMMYSRSPRGVLPSGEIVNYQKISSMGNGFTFELESLIFWALGSSVRSFFSKEGSPFSVYGDDLIISSDICVPYIHVLELIGFSCNKKKTFLSGPFRESCGKHYFRGKDVTPFYIRHRLNSHIKFVWMANTIKFWSAKLSGPLGIEPLLRPLYDEVCSYLPKFIRKMSAPAQFADFAIVRDFDEACPAWNRSLQAFAVRGFIPTTKTRSYDDDAYLLRALASLETSKPSLPDVGRLWEVVESRKSLTGLLAAGGVPVSNSYKIGTTYTTQWQGLGPWLENSMG